MTSVATSFFAPLAASSPGVVTAAQPAAVPFGAVLSAVATNDTGTAAAPGAALMDETTLATTGIATLLATASAAPTPPATTAKIDGMLATASPVVAIPVAAPTTVGHTTVTSAPVVVATGTDGTEVAADVPKDCEGAPVPSASITAPRPAPAMSQPTKLPGATAGTPSAAEAATLDPVARPETDAPAAAVVPTPPAIATRSASGDGDSPDRPKAGRPDDDRPTADAAKAPIVTLALSLAAVALAAPPPTPMAKPDTKADAKVDAPVAASSSRTGAPDARGQMPIAADQPVPPIGEGRGEHQAGTGQDAQGSPSHATPQTDTAPDPSVPRGGSAVFTLPSLPEVTTTRAAIATPATITAQPGRIGQELGVAIAHHVARGDATGGGDTITLRLNPADMGKIEVKLSFDDGGTLRAVVSADNATALDMLRRDSADLGRALTDAGVRADSQTLRFDSRAGSGQGGGQGGGNGNPWQRQADRRADTMSDTATGATDDIITAYRPLRMRGRVDMVA